MLLCALLASSVGAQTTAATAAAARVSPDGRLVATMRVGAALKTGATKGNWTAVTIEGFLHKSVVTVKKDAITIHASSGAALRVTADASAPVVAVIEDGIALDKQSASGDWFRVKRDLWVQTRELKTAIAKAPQGAPQRVAALPPRTAPVSVLAGARRRLASGCGARCRRFCRGASARVARRAGRTTVGHRRLRRPRANRCPRSRMGARAGRGVGSRE